MRIAAPAVDRPSPARRAANAAVLAGGVALAGWLWWDWWVFEFDRNEPWRALLSWWGDAFAVAWCLLALLTGRASLRLSAGRPAWWERDGATLAEARRAARWAWAGMTLSVAGDLGVTASQAWADRAGYARAAPVVGRVTGAEVAAADKHGDRQVRLQITFPTPAGPHAGRAFLNYRADGNPDLPKPLLGWLRRTIDGFPNGRAAPPAVGVRYDPEWPGRFWVDGTDWDDWSFARFFLMALPAMQFVWLLMDAPDLLRDGVADGGSLVALGPWAMGVVTVPLLIFCGVMQRMGW